MEEDQAERAGFQAPEWGVAFIGLILSGIFAIALLSVGVPPVNPFDYLLNAQLFLVSWAILASFQILLALYRHRPGHPLPYVAQQVFGKKYLRRSLQALPIIVTAIIFLVTFSAIKSAIPLFNEFHWDDEFIVMDQQIHGGDPWRLLQPILGFPIVTALLAAFYHLWLLLVYVGTIWLAIYAEDRALRIRYFLSFFLSWAVIGVALATAFASVGPCFLFPIMGDAHFLDQMAYLHSANEHFPIMVLDVQAMLLEGYETGNFGLGRGITAMPSMHVALAFVFFLAMCKVNRVAAILSFIFLVLIMLGSVHLAYHYAVDGYVSIAVAALIWLFSGSVADRWLGRSGEEPAPAA